MEINICIILDEIGNRIYNVPPQYTLDKLYEATAQYVCGQYIPTAFAHQAIMEKLFSQGYTVKWISAVI